MTRSRTHLRLAAVTLALLLLTAGCGAPKKKPLQLGIKRQALNLAFAEEDKAEPLTPRQIISVLPVPTELLRPGADLDRFRGTRPPRPSLNPLDCPKAKPGTFPKEPVPIFPRGAPKPGLYRYRNVGTVKVTTPLPLTLPYPPYSTVEIRKVVVTPEIAGQEDLPEAVRGLLGTGQVVTFEAFKKIGPTSITEQWRYDDSKLQLIDRVTVANGQKSTFHPTPAVTYHEFGVGEGDDWSTAGVDRDNDTALVVQGTIEKREFVDVCGIVYDAFKDVSKETQVNLATGDQSGTDPNQPNTYRYANHFGVLQLVEEGHVTLVTDVEGVSVVAELDYVSTVMSIEPTPARATAS